MSSPHRVNVVYQKRLRRLAKTFAELHFHLTLYRKLPSRVPQWVSKWLSSIPPASGNAPRDARGRIIDYSSELLENLDLAGTALGMIEPISPPSLMTYYMSF